MRNVTSGNISPQFHVVFDDLFSTVSTTFNDPTDSLDQVFSGPEWRDLVSLGHERYLPEDVAPPPLDSEWDPNNEQLQIQQEIQLQRKQARSPQPLLPPTADPIPDTPSEIDLNSEHDLDLDFDD